MVNYFDNAKFVKKLIDFFMSKMVIILIMLIFMGGVVIHLQNIFDSWFLAIGTQFTVLLLSINAKYLPSIKTESGADIPVLALIVSICIAYLLYMDLERESPTKLWTALWALNIFKAIFIASIEMSYSYLFVAKAIDKTYVAEDATTIHEKSNVSNLIRFTKD